MISPIKELENRLVVLRGDWTLRIAIATSMLMVARVKPNFEEMNEYRTDYLTLDAAGLLADFPPDFYDWNKRIVYGIGGPQTSGVITVSRWRAMPLPVNLGPRTAVTRLAGFFPYDGGLQEVWINFADPSVFAFYAGGLYAQDEMQVTEHPALASVRSAMIHAQGPALTRSGENPTPVLVRGVQRRVTVDTQPTAERPAGLYGARFAQASEEVLRSATRKIEPDSLTGELIPSTILAISAPRPCHGVYTRETILDALTTAFTGFVAAGFEVGNGTRIHSGFWGCGAFGGNRVLMIAVQILAARLAGVDMVFHYGEHSGEEACDESIALAETWKGTTAETVDRLVAEGFEWGMSDGN